MNMDKCAECVVEMVVSSGPGRMHKQRGELFEIPEDFEFMECPNCKAKWLTYSQVKELSNYVEAIRNKNGSG